MDALLNMLVKLSNSYSFFYNSLLTKDNVKDRENKTHPTGHERRGFIQTQPFCIEHSKYPHLALPNIDDETDTRKNNLVSKINDSSINRKSIMS